MLSPRTHADRQSRERTQQLGERLARLAAKKPGLAKAAAKNGLVLTPSRAAATPAQRSSPPHQSSPAAVPRDLIDLTDSPEKQHAQDVARTVNAVVDMQEEVARRVKAEGGQ